MLFVVYCVLPRPVLGTIAVWFVYLPLMFAPLIQPTLRYKGTGQLCCRKGQEGSTQPSKYNLHLLQLVTTVNTCRWCHKMNSKKEIQVYHFIMSGKTERYRKQNAATKSKTCCSQNFQARKAWQHSPGSFLCSASTDRKPSFDAQIQVRHPPTQQVSTEKKSPCRSSSRTTSPTPVSF